MAKKEEPIDMVDRFSEFKELKNIDKTTMISVLEESFRSVIAKMFGSDENFDVIVNPEKGDFSFVHASRTGVKVDMLSSAYYKKRYIGARRVL